MGSRKTRIGVLGKAALAALTLLVVLALAACADNAGGESGKPSESGPPQQDTSTQQQEPAPTYSHWLVYINDDQSASAGGMTYTVALNLKAKNTGSDPGGKYTGKATARTTTNGSVGGGTLSAEAIAQSSNLQFTLDATPVNSKGGTTDDPLAPLENDSYTYSGSGTITMRAAGTAHVGAAAGGFANNSSQKFTLSGSGSDITMKISIDGKKFTFKGTIRGEE